VPVIERERGRRGVEEDEEKEAAAAAAAAAAEAAADDAEVAMGPLGDTEGEREEAR